MYFWQILRNSLEIFDKVCFSNYVKTMQNFTISRVNILSLIVYTSDFVTLKILICSYEKLFYDIKPLLPLLFI